jgi:hypothetical protein
VPHWPSFLFPQVLLACRYCLVPSCWELFLSPCTLLVVILVQLCLIRHCSCCLVSYWLLFLSCCVVCWQLFLSRHVLLFWWIVSFKMMNACRLSSTFWRNVHVYWHTYLPAIGSKIRSPNRPIAFLLGHHHVLFWSCCFFFYTPKNPCR